MPSIEVADTRFDYDRVPDHCPLCHSGIEAVRIGSNSIVRREVDGGSTLQIIYRCPREKCQQAFIATYWQERGFRTRYAEGPFLLRRTAPFARDEPNTPDEIKALSPAYHTILSQSEAAEHYGLGEIAGCGYRKALEFLIKDYAIHKHPDGSEEIKAKLLGACINDYVVDANVKACAARAAWLGNDETHYVRRWEEKDINDLKVLLRLTAAWILNELLTEHYLRDMQ